MRIGDRDRITSSIVAVTGLVTSVYLPKSSCKVSELFTTTASIETAGLNFTIEDIFLEQDIAQVFTIGCEEAAMYCALLKNAPWWH